MRYDEAKKPVSFYAYVKYFDCLNDCRARRLHGALFHLFVFVLVPYLSLSVHRLTADGVICVFLCASLHTGLVIVLHNAVSQMICLDPIIIIIISIISNFYSVIKSVDSRSDMEWILAVAVTNVVFISLSSPQLNPGHIT